MGGKVASCYLVIHHIGGFICACILGYPCALSLISCHWWKLVCLPLSCSDTCFTCRFQNLVLWMLKSSWTLNDIPMSCTSALRYLFLAMFTMWMEEDLNSELCCGSKKKIELCLLNKQIS